MGANWNPGDQQPYNGDALVGAAAAIAAVQILFVAARFFTRFMQRMNIAVEDYLILLALVLIPIAYSYLNTIMLTSRCLGRKFGKISDLYCLYVHSLSNQLKQRNSHIMQWPESA